MTDAKGQPLSRCLACLGDSGDVNTWSGTPYYLFQGAKKNGFLTHTLNLLEPGYKRHRLTWSARQLLQLKPVSGYQFSRESARRMWECVPHELRRGEFLSHFQVFPPPDLAQAAGARFSVYIDTTLRQLFDYDQPGQRSLNPATQESAISRERELYHACRFVITMARRTADVVIRDYGVDPPKVHAVRPGANLDEGQVQAYLDTRGASWREKPVRFSGDNPARLGFIGRDWQRKGLDRLVAAAEILAQRGRPVRVTVLGAAPEVFANHPLVELLGLISKRTQMRQFLQAIDSFALGCLPSYFEPLGIGTLECLRLSVPVMGADVGGIPDCVPGSAGFLVPADADGAAIADAIEKHVFDASHYAALCIGAQAEAPNVTWEKAAGDLARIWGTQI